VRAPVFIGFLRKTYARMTPRGIAVMLRYWHKTQVLAQRESFGGFSKALHLIRKETIFITGLQYVRLPFGPTPDQYEFLLGILSSRGAVRIDQKPVGQTGEGEIITIASVPPNDESELDHNEIETLERVWKRFGKYSAKRLSSKSHQEKAWVELRDGDPIPYSYAVYLSD